MKRIGMNAVKKFLFKTGLKYTLTKHNYIAYSEAIAYPTIGIILLSGISDKNRRIPLHTSAGIAYTGLDSGIYTDTILYINEGKQEGFIDGEPVEYSDSRRSPYSIINNHREAIMKHLNLYNRDLSISFNSTNSNILSGSSDAGAAAIGADIAELSGGVDNTEAFENELRSISESVGRSYRGGLTLTHSSGKECYTESLLSPESFDDYAIIGCRFNLQRNPSDRIHENAVRHPEYSKRVERTEAKAIKLREYSEEGDIKSIFELSMEDTEDYHGILSQVGVQVIDRKMRTLMDKIKDLRKDLWMTYIVTGGSNVFVPVERKNLHSAIEELKGLCDGISLLKVAGKAHVVDKSLINI